MRIIFEGIINLINTLIIHTRDLRLPQLNPNFLYNINIYENFVTNIDVE